MTSQQKSVEILQLKNFHVIFKYLIGFALPTWESVESVPRLEGDAILIF